MNNAQFLAGLKAFSDSIRNQLVADLPCDGFSQFLGVFDDAVKEAIADRTPEPSYTISISEDQRKMISNALFVYPLRPNIPHKSEDVTELQVLFEALPKDEQEHPGVIHGLCL